MRDAAAVPAGTQVPAIGSVHGFRFSFGEQNIRYPHPGIVVMSRVGQKDGKTRCGVIALAITHSTQKTNWDNKDALCIPVQELEPMGLDTAEQWVCLFEQAVAYFPEDTKWIASAGSPHLGQASEAFTSLVIEAWNDFRRSR